ncbi:MAG TPA: hypothetical protein VEK57_02610 [Thermoanaerobaculia bacterium]|nr:hypothetical protein [Thermoanaerobaculia bacterium]
MREITQERDRWGDEDEGALPGREIIRTARRYRGPIALVLLGAAVLYTIFAVVTILLAPARKITTVGFRLEFRGADRGEYPNGTKFSSNEITGTPVLLRVFEENQVDKFISFETFKAAIYTSQSSTAREELEREYKTRLADPKLPVVDRERLEREFQDKLSALSAAAYTINFIEENRTFGGLPEATKAKLLEDILETWAEQTIVNKGVVLYDLAILSPSVFEKQTIENYDYVVALDILRSRIGRVISNVDALMNIPGSKVIRSTKTKTSLAELRVRLNDAVEFKLQPMVGMIITRGISKNPAATVDFLNARLRFNQIDLQEANSRVEAYQKSLALYTEQNQRQAAGTEPGEAIPGSGQVVIPQLGESLLDRLTSLSSESEDLRYRQSLVDRMTGEALAIAPMQAQAEYYRSLIASLQGFEGRARQPRPEELQALSKAIGDVVDEAVVITGEMNEIYRLVSRNLTPSTVLYSVTQPASVSIERAVSLYRLALVGVLVMLLAVPLVIAGAWLHSRFTPDEDAARA